MGWAGVASFDVNIIQPQCWVPDVVATTANGRGGYKNWMLIDRASLMLAMPLVLILLAIVWVSVVYVLYK